MLTIENVAMEKTHTSHAFDPTYHPFACIVLWISNTNQFGCVTSTMWARDASHAWEKLCVNNPDMPHDPMIRRIEQIEDAVLADMARYYLRKLGGL